MIIACPHCKALVDTEHAAYVEEDLVLCEHCGNDFLASRQIPPPETVSTSSAAGDPATGTGTISAATDPAAVVKRADVTASLQPQSPVTLDIEPSEPHRIVISADDIPGRPKRPPGSGAASAARSTRTWATLLWTLGNLILLLGLAAQYAYIDRDDLARYPILQPWIERLCAYTGCRAPLLRAPDQIKVMGRDVRRHPSVTDGLMVSLTFSNQASFRQAYPLVQLTFFDLHDQPVASRRFGPQEYLTPGTDITAGIPAGETVQATLEIVDPGPNAVNFMFEFY
jgi:hypothetical protein